MNFGQVSRLFTVEFEAENERRLAFIQRTKMAKVSVFISRTNGKSVFLHFTDICCQYGELKWPKYVFDSRTNGKSVFLHFTDIRCQYGGLKWPKYVFNSRTNSLSIWRPKLSRKGKSEMIGSYHFVSRFVP